MVAAGGLDRACWGIAKADISVLMTFCDVGVEGFCSARISGGRGGCKGGAATNGGRSERTKLFL